MMHQKRTKHILFISLAVFLLGTVAVAYHHHDNTILLLKCSLCKVKSSFSLSSGKIKADSSPDIAFAHVKPYVGGPFYSGILPEKKSPFVDSQVAVTYPNKAPPFSS